jgi:sugar phosphate isomerase/epimerase
MKSESLVRRNPALGALVEAGRAPELLEELIPKGFECFAIEFWESLGSIDLFALADELAEVMVGAKVSLSALSVFGNPLDPSGSTLASLEALIEAAPRFGVKMVSCFAGRKPGSSVPDSLSLWKEVFGRLTERAAAKDLTIAFENCRMGDTWKSGKWNIAINPDAWELLFEALPGAPIGLEWEPAHQILALADPIAQLEAWADRVVHVHGKDALLDRERLAINGYFGSMKAGREALPGSGETDWGSVIRILQTSGYAGSIDIELPADSEYRRGREVEGFSAAFDSLSEARLHASERIVNAR